MPEDLLSLSKKFAIDVVNACKVLKEERNEKILSSQLLRSGTSIGANIHEGRYASSRLDFINKFQIGMKECHETMYWLDILKETDYLTVDEYQKLMDACSKIRKILTASIVTAKNNERV